MRSPPHALARCGLAGKPFCGFGTGTTLWFSLVARMLVKHRSKFSPDVLSTIYRFAGGTLIVCACILTYHVVMSTNWAMLR